MNGRDRELILADAHVHIYDCFQVEKLLDAAYANFAQQARRMGTGDRFSGLLCLTEVKGYDWFHTLAEVAAGSGSDVSKDLGQWTVNPTHESCSLSLEHPSGKRLFLIAGRQVVTAEKLEVLALVSDRSFEDGLSLRETITAIAAADAIPVLPWGVGKWVGHRGKLLQGAILESDLPIFFLGDNSGRPVLWRKPALFSQIEQQGLPILPGTDPLPIASEACRPGSFGLAVWGTCSPQQPGTYMKRLLLETKVNFQPYGSLENPLRFVRNQVALRLT